MTRTRGHLDRSEQIEGGGRIITRRLGQRMDTDHAGLIDAKVELPPAAAPPRGPPPAHGARSRRRGQHPPTPPATATHTAAGGARGRLRRRRPPGPGTTGGQDRRSAAEAGSRSGRAWPVARAPPAASRRRHPPDPPIRADPVDRVPPIASAARRPHTCRFPVARRCCTNRNWPARCQPTGSSPADAIRRWSAEGGHPIQDRAAEDGLTPLPGWAPGAKTISDDGLVSEERVLHPALTMVP